MESLFMEEAMENNEHLTQSQIACLTQFTLCLDISWIKPADKSQKGFVTFSVENGERRAFSFYPDKQFVGFLISKGLLKVGELIGVTNYTCFENRGTFDVRFVKVTGQREADIQYDKETKTIALATTAVQLKPLLSLRNEVLQREQNFDSTRCDLSLLVDTKKGKEEVSKIVKTGLGIARAYTVDGETVVSDQRDKNVVKAFQQSSEATFERLGMDKLVPMPDLVRILAAKTHLPFDVK